MTVVVIQRVRRPPHPVTFTEGALTLYEIELSAAPSKAWRATFLRPPPALTTTKYTPGRAWLGIEGRRVTFRTIPARVHAWLRWIDRWVAYANSVVNE